MALAERLEELQRPKNGLSSSRRRTLQPRTTLLFTTTYGSILFLLLLFFFSLYCVNGQYSPYNEHAKFPSLFRSSAAVAAAVRSQQTAFSATADKDGGASEEAVLKSSTGENAAAAAAAAADNSLKQWSSFAEGADFNVNLDIGLVDVEPEANLFLDETPLLARTGGGASSSSSSASQQKQDTSSRSNGGGNALDGGSSVRETRHLALVHSASSVVVRATYGPFTARQTINPFSVPKNTSSSPTTTAGSSSWSASSTKELKNKSTTNNVNNVNSRPAQSSAGAFRNSNFLLSPEQITAYLVTKEVRRSHPVLRVLFYASHLAEYRSHASFAQSSSFSSMRGTPGMEEEEEEDKTLCAAVIVQYHGERLFGTCSPSSSKQNACLAEVTIPALYWPPLDVSNGGLYAAKQQKSSTAKVYYTIAHTAAEQACTDQNFLSLLAASSTEASNDNGGEGQNSKDSNRAAEQGEPAVNADLAAAAAHMNLVYLSEVSLVPFRGSYEEVTNDNVVTVLIPQEPVYPNSKIYIPVKYTYNPDYPVAAFSLRVQVKPGLKILGAQLSHPNKLWQLSVELGAKQTTATVTAFLRDFVGGGGGGGGVPLDQQQPNSGQQFGQQQQQSDSSGGSGQSGQSSGQLLPDELLENSSQEVYSWLIEVEGDIDISEVNGRIVWQLLYNTDMEAIVGKGGGGGGGGNGGNGGNVNFLPLVDMQAQQSQQAQEDEDFERESVKLTSLIDIQKDVVAEVLAITRRRELLNTALLNGRQVSRAMRVLQVSAAGSISDITFQCSCQSADESILKVSPSCTSVYLDGSEVRGSQNASVLIKYGSFTGLGSFIVWMPLIPLDVRVADSKLSQIKGWRVPFYLPKRQSLLTTMTNNNPFAEFNENTESRFDFLDQQMLMDRAERSSGGGSGGGGGGLSEADKYPWTASASAGSSAGGSSSAGGASSSSSGNSGSCRLRYQQTRVEVYTRFLSTDHNSGREASLLNRRHSLRITHLVRPLIRVTDGKVLRLRSGGAQVEGVGVGRADVEVISPLTGSVIGSREVRVTADREAISRLEVRPVSGLKLQVEPPRLEGGPNNGGHNHIWTTSVELNSRLTRQYQEALLDGRLLFTDGTVVALSELSPADYDLSVDTYKGVVAHVSRGVSGVVSSSSSAHHAHLNNGGGSSSASSVHHSVFGHSAHHELPRIIALLPGQGELVHLTLDLPYACQRKKKSQPLASAYVDIDVHFQLPESSEEEEEGQGQQGHSSSLQNDAINGYGRGRLSGGSGGGGRLHGLNDTISKGGSKDAFRLMGGGGGGGGLLKKRPSSMLSSRRGGLLYQSAAAEERERITYQRHSGTSSVNSVNQKASEGGGGMGTGVGGSHLELGMYSLLTVVSVASIIVVVLYSVFSLRNYRYGGGKGDGHVTTTATSENGGGEDGGGGLRGVSRQFLSCVNSSSSSSPGGHHTHRHHRGHHHHQSGGSSSGGVQVTNAAKEWVWVGGSHFNGGSRCGGGAVRQSQQQQQENENEPSEEMLEVRRPLLPMHHLHHQHYHHHHQHRNYHHPHCTDHNGNLTMTSTEATKSATGARQAPLLHGSSTLELEVQLGSSSSTAHGRQSGSSGLSGGGGTGGGGTGGFRITANPAETLLLATSGQFDFQEQLPGTLGARSDEPEDLPPSSTAATATAASLISRRQQQQQHQCTEPNATLLQSVLIPMNHKSTRIKTTSSSGLSFLRAASPLDEPPPPIPARTRHIPLPKGGSSNCTKPTIGAGKGVQKKGPSPPIWRHHHNQPLQSWQELTGGGQEQQQEQATSSSPSAPPPPPIPPHKSQRGSGSDSASSDLSAGSSTHSHSHSHSRPPPIPPHRAGSNGSVSSRTLSSASTSSSSASTGGNQREGRSPQPVRPKHLRLAKRHTPQNSGVHHHSNTVGGNVELLQQEQQQQQPPPPLDYRAMMKVLERLKESSA